MRKATHLIFLFFLLPGLLFPSGFGLASAPNQGDTAAIKALNLLKKMTPEERVGQLFLVSFTGSKAGTDSQIYDLITNRHVGGVVLTAENNNFVGPENTLVSIHRLISDLQSAGGEPVQSGTETQASAGYIPLFVGISQQGDAYPNDQILTGLTALPDQMAIGATWNTDYSRIVGSTLGNELEILGFNMLFGPSLDVLDSVLINTGEDLGVSTFGGDPFWVGEMGKAYIEGVHKGSEGRIAVIATHFPGRGGSDRRPEEEIATVRKSLEQLKQIELAPFFSVTGKSGDVNQTVDGLLLSHIRYQGFQGNIRATTKPVSFDAAALELIMNLPELSTWRKQGGMIVSDDLGSEAVRRFFDPLNTGFDVRQVARSALLAGNDLLYMGNIISTGDSDSYTTLTKTIDYFNQRYLEDSTFQARVDQAVMNILMTKFMLYPDFQLEEVLTDPNRLNTLGLSQYKIVEIAQKSVTLINPDAAGIVSVLPNPPQFEDRIVFISDMITYRQCASCGDQTNFLANSLMEAVTRLYGPGSGNQIQASHMHAYSFENLRVLLEKGTGTEALQNDLGGADWIIFAFSESDQTQTEKNIFEKFFSQRPDLARNKKIIGMAFNIPYYLDATNISKLTAYYALYSKVPEFLDVAARVLFQELIPEGDPPVSVPGIGYDLISVTSPDPNQVIPLYIASPGESNQVEGTPPTGYSKPLQYKAGDTIPIQAGVILDKNGHPVPDGTIVRFLIDSRSSNGTLEQIEVQTIDGIANVTYTLPSIGSLELRVEADPALTSQILRLDITSAGGVITSFQPTPAPEESQEVIPTPLPTPTLEPNSVIKHNKGELTILDWFLSTVLIFGVCLLFNFFSRKSISKKWNTFTTLSMALGGSLAYAYVAVSLPGASAAVQTGGTGFALIAVILGILAGLGIGFVAFWFDQKKRKVISKQ